MNNKSKEIKRILKNNNGDTFIIDFESSTVSINEKVKDKDYPKVVREYLDKGYKIQYTLFNL